MGIINMKHYVFPRIKQFGQDMLRRMATMATDVGFAEPLFASAPGSFQCVSRGRHAPMRLVDSKSATCSWQTPPCTNSHCVLSKALQKPDIRHRKPEKLPALGLNSGKDITEQLIGNNMLDHDLGSTLLRLQTQLDRESSPEIPYLNHRHIFECDFSTLALSETSMSSFLEIQNQFIGSTVQHAIEACQLFYSSHSPRRLGCVHMGLADQGYPCLRPGRWTTRLHR